MRTWLSLLVLIALLPAVSAGAADSQYLKAKPIPGDAAPQPTQQELHPLLDDPSIVKEPENLTDYANLYYKRCVGANTDPGLLEYQKSQCACTSAQIPEILDMKQAAAVLDPKSKDAESYTRLMYLAFTPCLKDTIRDFAFDSCLDDPSIKQKVRHQRGVCTCIADQMGQYMGESGYVLLPGRARMHFDMEKISPDPLGAIITSPGYVSGWDFYARPCLLRKEYGW